MKHVVRKYFPFSKIFQRSFRFTQITTVKFPLKYLMIEYQKRRKYYEYK
jgi:hypothetical protein